MNKKNIFEKNKAKKSVYYIVLGLCIAVIGAASFITYKSIQNSLSNQKIDSNTNNIDKVDTKVENIKKDETDIPKQQEPVAEKAPEPTPEVQAKSYMMPVSGEITVGFSIDTPVYSETLKDWRIHDGIDIAADLGTTVKAVNDGVIESITNDDLFGITVVIKHTDGKKSLYSNLADNVELEQGQIINRGDTIGKIGNSAICEISDGPHLHFEMSENGNKVDPQSIIKK